LSTALSVGAVAAVFTAVEAVLIKPLPYARPDELVLFRGDLRNVRESEGDWLLKREAEEILRRSRTIESAGVWGNAVFDLGGDGNNPPEALYGLRVTASLLPTLGVTPILGRNIQKSEEDDTTGVMILSYGLWMRRFHGDRGVVGRTVTVNGHGCRIVGVMGLDFNFPLRREAVHTPQPYVEFWAPMSLEKQNPQAGQEMVGRLKRGVTFAEAQQEAGVIGEALAREFPDSNGNRILRASGLRERAIGQAGKALWLLMGAACLFLLIGCANVANLLLARGLGRRWEMAIRMALGAGRRRIARQLLTEGCVLAALGGAAAYGVAVAAWQILPALAPRTIPRLGAAHADWRVLAFALIAAVINGLLFGLAPALRASRQGELSTRGAASGQRDWLRRGLVAAEVAITVTLVVTGGRLLGSFMALLGTDPGFAQDRVLAAVVLPQPDRYRDPAARALVYRRFLGAAREIPGVVMAGTVDALPFSGENHGGFVTTRTQDIANRAWQMVAEVDVVGGDYLAAMGARLEEGRWFHEEEKDTAIISDVTARKLWPGESALEKRVCVHCTPEQPDSWKRVVGVTSNMRHLGLEGETEGAVYLADDAMRRAQFLVVRTERPASEYQQALRRAVASVDPQQPVLLSASMQTLVADSLAARRFLMVLLGVTACLALTMSVAGIYGVMAYTTSRRTQEIGIRMALGATPRKVHGLVFREGFGTVAAGLAIGGVITLAAEKALRAALPGLTGGGANDLWLAAVLVIATAVLACWLPSRRAMRLDPMTALRAE
jgi:putative ABC transport system permease protein